MCAFLCVSFRPCFDWNTDSTYNKKPFPWEVSQRLATVAQKHEKDFSHFFFFFPALSLSVCLSVLIVFFLDLKQLSHLEGRVIHMLQLVGNLLRGTEFGARRVAFLVLQLRAACVYVCACLLWRPGWVLRSSHWGHFWTVDYLCQFGSFRVKILLV